MRNSQIFLIKKYLENDPKRLNSFERYSKSVEYRFEYAQDFYTEILKFSPSLINGNTNTSGTNGSPDKFNRENITDNKIFKPFNRLLDCYFLITQSGLDVLAHIVNLLFEFMPLGSDVYIKYLKDQNLEKLAPTIYDFAKNFLNDETVSDFMTFRNKAAHVDLLCQNYEKKVDIIEGDSISYTIKIINEEGAIKEFDVKEFIQKTHPKINDFYNNIFIKIYRDLKHKQIKLIS